VARINRSRIPVWTIVHLRQLGATEKDILKSYPTLTWIDVAQALLYTAAHPKEKQKQIRENEEE
jgi:uncharacterized protein (DUF433 family)